MQIQTIETEVENFRNMDKKEPGWVYRLRKEAWNIYHDSPLPQNTTNVWRYTRPEQFLIRQPDIMMNVLPLIPDGSNGHRHPVGVEYAAYGYNRDDRLTLTRTGRETEESGVIFKDLYSALRENGDLTSPYFGQLIGADFGKFEALNMSLWNTGFFLYVPDNTIIEKPIRMNRHPGGLFTIGRLLVVVGKNSRATIIDDFSGDCRLENPIANSTAEIYADSSSRVRYVNFQRLASKCTSYFNQRARLGQDAEMDSIFGGMGSGVSKVNAGVILDGRGAASRMYGVIFGDKDQHFDYHTIHHHTEGESFSNINFKVILKDEATSAYTGLIRIEKEAANCEAYQENRNLLLNKGTKAESIPELEILTDQVRCTHGATMGPVDPDMTFYLKSRGINSEEAIKMIVSGFVEPTINQIPPDLQNMMRTLVSGKLGEN
jgi:Fe-S cluster assembly protein SufD